MAALSREDFGRLPDGRRVERLAISAGALTARVLTLGAILHELRLAGVDRSLTIAGGSLADCLGTFRFHGAVVGPVANRIAGAAAVIAGRPCRLTANEGPNTLHGGAGATHDRLWQVASHAPDRLTLTLALPDGEGGFPGDREIPADFAAEAPATLTLTLRATTDAPTLLNLANHSYWQLAPAPRETQTLTCAAASFVALDAAKLPTGTLAPVADTALDFRAGAPVGGRGIDNCLCLAPARRGLAHAATLAAGGLRMELETTEPGLQVYDGHAAGGVALEAQNWPDAAHHPHFPSDLLLPGEVRTQITRWRFARA
ncbi:MAG: galactose mutarotase [Rhodobacteraceae bacterium]|nr:galactose mutarotase [Paracoccaceae bacterium]